MLSRKADQELKNNILKKQSQNYSDIENLQDNSKELRVFLIRS